MTTHTRIHTRQHIIVRHGLQPMCSIHVTRLLEICFAYATVTVSAVCFCRIIIQRIATHAHVQSTSSKTLRWPLTNCEAQLMGMSISWVFWFAQFRFYIDNWFFTLSYFGFDFEYSFTSYVPLNLTKYTVECWNYEPLDYGFWKIL